MVVALVDCCKPRSNGGLTLRDLRIFNEARLKKITWSFINEDSFVFKFLRDRFLKDCFSPIEWQRSSVGYVLYSHLQSFCLSLFGLLEVTLRCSFGRIIGLVRL